MNLLPQDIFVMVKLAVSTRPEWTFNSMAHELGMSPSMAHGAVKRATQARLYDPNQRMPRRKALEEFLVHGVKYAFPPDLGSATRGVPTAWASPSLEGKLVQGEEEVYVWPHPRGEHRGIGLSPLYKSVPEIVLKDHVLYAALSLLDAIRIGRAREQTLAEELLRDMLGHAA